MNRHTTLRVALLATLTAPVVIVIGTPPAWGQPATKSQQACINGLAKTTGKLIKASEKEIGSCVKSTSKEKLEQCTDADACVVGDLKGKIAKADAAVLEAGATGCAFGLQYPAWFSGDTELALVLGKGNPAPSAYLFGPLLDAATVRAATDKNAAKCQGKVQKSAAKLSGTIFKAFAGCTKAGLKDETIDSAAALQACFDTLVLDAKGKIAKSEGKIGSTVTKSCAGVDLDQAFPGPCVGAPAASACFSAQIRCRSCQLLNQYNGVAYDCDLFDDTTANGSCTIADGRCNGSGALCSRTFDAVSYATAHNAMSNDDEDWAAPLQTWGISEQLANGVRSLMLDTHYFEGAPHLCHASCDLNELKTWREPLVDGLVRIREFLETRPNEVVSIIFESYITEADTATEFTAAGLDPYLHSQTAGQPWPTLQQMIDADTRLVVLTDDSNAALSWHHYLWTDFAWETHFSYQEPGDFSCAGNRGTPGNDLFIFNHFLTNPIGLKAFAEMVNYNPMLGDRAAQCETESGQLPNFVTVDFVDVGDVFTVVHDLNDLGTCTN
jgi:hypothetical protein